jgi:Starch-binding associating with outer membrane
MFKQFLLLSAAATLWFSSCGKFVDGYEISPNEPTESTPGLLLNVSQLQTFLAYSGELARISAIFTQHQSGTDFQYADYAAFGMQPGDYDNSWENIYSAMLDAKTLSEKAGASNPYYRGMGKVLLAMNLGIATDTWGDVPYTEALLGQGENGNLNPKYDSQESIIQNIQILLSEAIIDFNTDEEANILIPDTDDMFFQGDMNNWIYTAYILKARYANRLSERNASGSATDALAYLDAAYAAGLSTSSTNCNAVFGNAGNENNQWYSFVFQERPGYMQMGKLFVDSLVSMNDPRLSAYANLDANGAYSGTPLADFDQTTSTIGTYFASANSKSPLVTYAEAKFIEAEAALRSGDAARAATAHNTAIITHIEFVTGATAPATYVQNYANETNSTISLEKIIFQKYLAGFTQIECWVDWRRTGFPNLPMTPNARISAIPRRLQTPLTELNYNSNAPANRDLLAPVWWDN